MAEQIETAGCTCNKKDVGENKLAPRPRRPIFLVIVGIALWWLVYLQLKPLAEWASFSLFGLEEGTHLGEAVSFFLYDTPKVLMLLVLVVFLIGIVRSFITVGWTRKLLSGKKEAAGNVLAALLGVATPFCSCSAVPLFIGFMTAGIPLGVTFSFLISAPMVNEIALIMLYGMLGWKVALIYFVTGVSIAIVAGWVLGRMGLEGHIEEWVLQIRAGEAAAVDENMTFNDRLLFGLDAVREIVGKVWMYVIAGIGVGALIHGYIPDGFLAGIMGDSSWWSVPLSILIGVPMYTNAAGVIPIIDALLGKGAALGTALAFMMSVIALSFPEMVILRKVLKPRLIALFIAVVASGILVVGYLFNSLGLEV